MKKRVFIASSVEGLEVAYSIQECLEYDFEMTVWPQGVFELSKTALESLENALTKFDAAIFVFAPSDEVIVRDLTKPAVRDNVIFELGLFIGAIGRRCCFIVKPKSFLDSNFPSDLFGIVPGSYDDKREDRNLVAALGPACNKIRRALGTEAPLESTVPGTDLAKILQSQPFRLVFKPPAMSKRIVFGSDGLIHEGNNKNEHTWRLVDQKLELVQLDGKVHSRFAYDPKDGAFKHTNDRDTLSIRGQYIVPDVKR